MIGFSLTEEQRALQALAREFAEKEIKPVALELDSKSDPADCFSWDLLRKMSRAGLRTIAIPTKYGGGGIESCLTLCIVSEELGVGDTQIAAIPMFSMKMAHLFQHGTEEQREKYLRAYCQDDECLMCNSITEPDAGSDNMLPYDAPNAGMMTSVRRDGDYYILNGRKHYIQNSDVAKIDLVWARTDPTVGVSKGTTCFIVTRPRDGYSVVRVHDKVGQRLMNNCEIVYDNVRVHKSDVLGAWNGGRELLRTMLFHGDNMVNGARILGVARAIYEASLAYAKERVQGGKPIIKHQLVAADLADMFMQVEAARTFLWYAAWRVENRDTIPFDPKYGGMACALCQESSARLAVKALAMWGGAGCMKELPLQKYLRDAVTSLHWDGGVHLKRVVTASFM